MAWSVSRFGCAIGLGLLATLVQPANAEDFVFTCPKSAADTQTATLIFDPKVFGIDSHQDDAGSAYEMTFDFYAKVRAYDESKPGWEGPKLCEFAKSWQHDLPIPNILYEFNSYPMAERIILRNVPRHSTVNIALHVKELDDFDDDWADFSRYPDDDGDIDIVVFTDTLKAQSMIGRREGAYDISFGKDKRLVGDGKHALGSFEAFRAMLEFNLALKFDANPGANISPNLPSPGQPVNPAANEPACRDYALKAVEMNVEAQKLGCGFAAPVWSNDHQMHFGWCMQGANATFAQGENASRQVDLDLCRAAAANQQPPAPPPPAPAPLPGLDLCGVYANEAVKAAVTAAVWGCGFSGPRWVQDFGAHYNFCKSNPLPPLVLAEQAIRDSQLQACLAAKGN